MREQVYNLQSAANSSASERAGFIRRTYLHVAGAIAAFAMLEVIIFKAGFASILASTLLGSQYSWLIVLGLFMGVSFVADKFAHSQTSEGAQYFGLGLFVVAEAIIFVPILFIADSFFHGAIETAGLHNRSTCHWFNINSLHYKKRFFFHVWLFDNWVSYWRRTYYLQYNIWFFSRLGIFRCYVSFGCRFCSLHNFQYIT